MLYEWNLTFGFMYENVLWRSQDGLLETITVHFHAWNDHFRNNWLIFIHSHQQQCFLLI